MEKVITKSGPEPEYGHENALFSRRAIYILGPSQLAVEEGAKGLAPAEQFDALAA
jgi:hypothetical protein